MASGNNVLAMVQQELRLFSSVNAGFFEKTDVGINTVKVGIGTTNPIAQLDVNVGSSVTALNIEGT